MDYFIFITDIQNMDMTRERISFTFDPRDMLLSLHIGFSFVRFALACAALERTPGFDDCSYIHLKLVIVPFWLA